MACCDLKTALRLLPHALSGKMHCLFLRLHKAWHGAAGVREHGALHLYSLMGGSDVAEVPGPDVLFRMVALRGWWLNVWLASLSQPQLHAALQARGPAHALRHTSMSQCQV